MRAKALMAIGFRMSSAAVAQPVELASLALPSRFRIANYSSQVPNARELALGANGTVFVGSREAGKVYALTESMQKGTADKARVVASGLQIPSGIAFHNGDLYIGAVSRIFVLRDIEQHLDAPPTPELITDKLPDKTHHGCKFLAFGPDGRIYVPVGAPCNVCDPGRDFAKLISMKADGSDWRDVAFGIRNSVRFDWQPGTQHLWFTDNGRDMLGDDLPSDELNQATRAGQHFRISVLSPGRHARPGMGQAQVVQRLRAAGAQNSVRTSRHSACVSTTDRCFQGAIAAPPSSPSTAHGIVRRSGATA